MSRYVVHKLNLSGEITLTYEAELAERLPDGVRLNARWTRPTLALDYTTFETGDHFIEWYFSTHWYNIFEVRAESGPLKGWYCNVAEPATITADTVACRDLYLDLWVAPDGTMHTLDVDEFEAATDLDETTRMRAWEALAQLQRMATEREAPFDAIDG